MPWGTDCPPVAQIKLTVCYHHLIVMFCFCFCFYQPKSLKFTTPGELNCTVGRIHSCTLSRVKLKAMVENEEALDCCSVMFGELDNCEFLEHPKSNLHPVPAEATSPSLALVSSSFLHDGPVNVLHEIVILQGDASSSHLNISTSILCLKVCKWSQVPVCPREPITK